MKGAFYTDKSDIPSRSTTATKQEAYPGAGGEGHRDDRQAIVGESQGAKGGRKEGGRVGQFRDGVVGQVEVDQVDQALDHRRDQRQTVAREAEEGQRPRRPGELFWKVLQRVAAQVCSIVAIIIIAKRGREGCVRSAATRHDNQSITIKPISPAREKK